MSDFWISQKRYFCKYCEIYIADNVPSRQHHEGGLRHQGNRERFIRNIYKTSEKKKKDSEEEKRELARIEQAAHAAFAQDVSAGYARPAIASTSASASTTRKPALKPSNPFANYTTAESLGYGDPDAERADAEAERRRTQGVVGEWQPVTPSPQPPVEEENAEAPTSSVQIPVKREAEVHSDDDFDRHSKLRKRTVRAGLGEIYDPGIIPIKVKKMDDPAPVVEIPKAEARDDNSPSVIKLGDDVSKPTGPNKWVKVQWKRPEESSLDGTDGSTEQMQDGTEGDIPGESQDKTSKTEDMASTKIEEPLEVPTGGGSLFKKRRTPASVVNKGQRF